MLDKIKSFKYFPELAFAVALILIVFAWKWGIEGVIKD